MKDDVESLSTTRSLLASFHLYTTVSPSTEICAYSDRVAQAKVKIYSCIRFVLDRSLDLYRPPSCSN